MKREKQYQLMARELLEELKEDQKFIHSIKSIQTGKFPRDISNAIYSDRLYYTNKLRFFLSEIHLMNQIFSNQGLKSLFFQTFGYEKNVNFTIYPNTWLRDLPLLDIGENVYLGDHLILGTNRITPDQKEVIVAPITIGDNTIFDQSCAIGCGSNIGKNTQVAFNVAISSKCKIGSNVIIGSQTGISHCVRIGSDVTIGDACKIGQFAIIEDGAKVPDFTQIPAFTTFTINGEMIKRR